MLSINSFYPNTAKCVCARIHDSSIIAIPVIRVRLLFHRSTCLNLAKVSSLFAHIPRSHRFATIWQSLVFVVIVSRSPRKINCIFLFILLQWRFHVIFMMTFFIHRNRHIEKCSSVFERFLSLPLPLSQCACQILGSVKMQFIRFYSSYLIKLWLHKFLWKFRFDTELRWHENDPISCIFFSRWNAHCKMAIM